MGEGPSGSPAAAEDPVVVRVSNDGVPLEGVIQIEKPGDRNLVSYAKLGLLASGNVPCLLVFSAIARFSHGLPVLDAEMFKTADPSIAGWLLSAYLLGGFGDDTKGRNGAKLPSCFITVCGNHQAKTGLLMVQRRMFVGDLPWE